MEFVLEFLLVIVEIIFELFGEVLFEGLLRTKGPSWRPSKPVAILIAVGLGAFVGALSLELAPRHLIHNETLRLVNLLLAPVFGGAAAAVFLRVRAKRGEPPLPLERGTMGALVAFGVAVVRWWFAT